MVIEAGGNEGAIRRTLPEAIAIMNCSCLWQSRAAFYDAGLHASVWFWGALVGAVLDSIEETDEPVVGLKLLAFQAAYNRGPAFAKLYFCLSSLSSWAARDGKFSYEDFYWSIVDIFDNGNGQPILDRFNYNVFRTDSTASQEEPEAPAELSAFERLAAQRAAKRARTEGST
ncbi:hypothetical protein B0H13DRAFT_1890741 [Mycena leptocephala]|nr:hypothetical protein B0H13DRAFT_1890741 [Mycena leptocephala]